MKKQTENTFTEGLIMDTHPLTTPSNALSNCLNGTLITYNGNEFILLNDMGNVLVDTAALPPGYVPVGIKLYGGIVYVASYNPLTSKSLIGSFPSPERNISSDEADAGPDKKLTINQQSQSNLVCAPLYKLRMGDTFSINFTLNVSGIIACPYTKFELLYVSAGSTEVAQHFTTSYSYPPALTEADDIKCYNNNLIIGRYKARRAGQLALRVSTITPEYINFKKFKLEYSASGSTLRCTVQGRIVDKSGNAHTFENGLSWSVNNPKAATVNIGGCTLAFNMLVLNKETVTQPVAGEIVAYHITTSMQISDPYLDIRLQGFEVRGVRNSALEGSNKVLFTGWKFMATEKGTAVNFGLTCYPDDETLINTSLLFYDINEGVSQTEYLRKDYYDVDGVYTYINYPYDEIPLKWRHAYFVKILVYKVGKTTTEESWTRFVLCTPEFNKYYYTTEDYIDIKEEEQKSVMVKWETTWETEEDEILELISNFFSAGNSTVDPVYHIKYGGSYKANVEFLEEEEAKPFKIDVSNAEIKGLYDTASKGLAGLSTYKDRITNYDSFKLTDDDVFKWKYSVSNLEVKGTHANAQNFKSPTVQLSSTPTNLHINSLFLPSARAETMLYLFGTTDWTLNSVPYICPFVTKNNDTGTKDTARFHVSKRQYNENSNSIDGTVIDCTEYRTTSGTTTQHLYDYKTLLAACYGSNPPVFGVLSGGSSINANKGLAGGDFTSSRFLYRSGRTCNPWYNVLMSHDGVYRQTTYFGESDPRQAMIRIRDFLKYIYVNGQSLDISVRCAQNTAIAGLNKSISLAVLVDPKARLLTVDNEEKVWSDALNEAATAYTDINKDSATVNTIKDLLSYDFQYYVESENTPTITIKVGTDAMHLAILKAIEEGIDKAYVTYSYSDNGDETLARLTVDNTLVPSKVYDMRNGVKAANKFTWTMRDSVCYAYPYADDLSGTLRDMEIRSNNDFLTAVWDLSSVNVIELTKIMPIS